MLRKNIVHLLAGLLVILLSSLAIYFYYHRFNGVLTVVSALFIIAGWVYFSHYFYKVLSPPIFLKWPLRILTIACFVTNIALMTTAQKKRYIHLLNSSATTVTNAVIVDDIYMNSASFLIEYSAGEKTISKQIPEIEGLKTGDTLLVEYVKDDPYIMRVKNTSLK